jgi:hypothetical protein
MDVGQNYRQMIGFVKGGYAVQPFSMRKISSDGEPR